MLFAVIGLFSVGCDGSRGEAAWWQGEQEKIELEHQLELKSYRFEQRYSRDFEELGKFRIAIETSHSLIVPLRQQRLDLTENISLLEGQWSAFRESTIREKRQRAIGQTFQELGLISGRKFQNVSVAAIDDAGVTIRHADGSARLRFADLSSSQRVLFGLEGDLAVAAEEKEAKNALNYERWIDLRMSTIQEKESKAAESARRVDLAAREKRSMLAARELAVAENRPLAQAATTVGTRSSSYYGYYSNYRYYSPYYRTVYYQTPNSYTIPNYSSNQSGIGTPFYPSSSAWTGGGSHVCPQVIPPPKSMTDTIFPTTP